MRAPYRAGLCWYAGLLHASPNVCAKRPLEHGTKQCCSTGLREPHGPSSSYASPIGFARISQSSAPSPARGPRRELREGGRSKIRIFRIQYSSSLSGPCTCISPEGLVLPFAGGCRPFSFNVPVWFDHADWQNVIRGQGAASRPFHLKMPSGAIARRCYPRHTKQPLPDTTATVSRTTIPPCATRAAPAKNAAGSGGRSWQTVPPAATGVNPESGQM